MASPTEASGTVTNVVDGDTFDIRIEDTDSRIIYEIERVRLADVDSPEMSTPEGPLAKAYTTEALLGQKVWLDIDDKSEDGRVPEFCDLKKDREKVTESAAKTLRTNEYGVIRTHEEMERQHIHIMCSDSRFSE